MKGTGRQWLFLFQKLEFQGPPIRRAFGYWTMAFHMDNRPTGSNY